MVERTQNSKEVQGLTNDIINFFDTDGDVFGLTCKVDAVVVYHLLTHPDAAIRQVATNHLEKWTAVVTSIESTIELAKEGIGVDLVLLDKLIKSRPLQN